MKSFGSIKKLIDKGKNGENVPSLEVDEVVLVQPNLVDNQYQHKSVVLYYFMPSKSYVYLLNVEPSNLVFLKTYSTECNDITIAFTDQMGFCHSEEIYLTNMKNNYWMLLQKQDQIF